MNGCGTDTPQASDHRLRVCGQGLDDKAMVRRTLDSKIPVECTSNMSQHFETPINYITSPLAVVSPNVS